MAHHGRVILALARRRAGQEQGLRLVGLELQRPGDELFGTAGEAPFVELDEDVGVVEEQAHVVVDQRTATAVGFGGLGVAAERFVGTGQHHPALEVVRLRLEAGLELAEHGLDLLRIEPGLGMHRVERLRLPEPGVTGGGENRQGEEQDQCAARAAARACRRVRGLAVAPLFEQTLAQLVACLRVFGLGQRAGGTVALKLGQLVAVDREVGGAAVAGFGRGRACAAQQRRQDQRQSDGQQQRGPQEENDGWGHASRSPESSRRSAWRRCASVSGVASGTEARHRR